jgi:hypothetical protein
MNLVALAETAAVLNSRRQGLRFFLEMAVVAEFGVTVTQPVAGGE